MGISYSTYIGPYFYCSKQAYKEWEGEKILEELYLDEFCIEEIDTPEDSIVFIPNKLNWGLHLNPHEIDGQEIQIKTDFPDEVKQLREEYRDVIGLLPNGVEARYGVVLSSG